VGAVRYQSFAFVKPQSVVRPKDLFAHPIGNVDQAVAIQGDHARLRDVKIGIVSRYDGIV
jgi:hypothetical protein